VSYTRECADCTRTFPLVRFPKSGSGRLRTCETCTASARRKRRDPAAERARRLERQYGITAAEYRSMGARQRWRCAICDRPPRPQDGRLVVDHDHASGEVRALLCHPCNAALGLLGDKPDRLVAAAEYLRRFSGDP